MDQLISAISRPPTADPLRDMARFVTERRAHQAQAAALSATLAMQSDLVESLDPRVGRNLDRSL